MLSLQNGKILQRFGCSKCIKETPNSNATTGGLGGW
jgi:hypothetical protein